MQRRTLLRRLAGAGATGGLALAATRRELTVVWTFADGTTERIAATAFDRRDDTPPLAALTDDCCDCPDPTVCQCSEQPPCTA